MPEENVGVDNQAYVDRDGNQNSVARAEEIEVVNTQDDIEEVETSSSSNSWSPYLQVT